MEKYLAVDLALFREYHSGQRSDIAFDNLWMLFDSKVFIYCPFRRGECKIVDEQDKDRNTLPTRYSDVPQVSCVLATLGGTARSPAAPTDSQFTKGHQRKARLSLASNSQGHIRDKRVSLFVDSYHIRFDGVRFRPVADAFEFKPFQGELPITSLEAYPLAYHTNLKGNAIELLNERGALYADLTTVKHVSYKGLTLGERKEEVSSSGDSS